jgi:hypothetical protein
MQISNVQAGHNYQSVQRLQTQSTKVVGSKSEETNESASERAAEAQRSAVAQSTGVGLNVDKSA